MPVRKIGPRYGSIRGKIGNKEAQEIMPVESTLERDYLLILRFSLGFEVESYETQPVEIEYSDSSGKLRSCFPDVHVVYTPGMQRKPSLVEVKPEEVLREHWLEWKDKFKAAHAYAREQGGRFLIRREKHIRTPYLFNARFLQRSKYRQVDEDEALFVLKTLEQSRGEIDTPQALLDFITADRMEQAKIKPVLLHLIAWRRIATDLTKTFNDQSKIWCPKED